MHLSAGELSFASQAGVCGLSPAAAAVLGDDRACALWSRSHLFAAQAVAYCDGRTLPLALPPAEFERPLPWVLEYVQPNLQAVLEHDLPFLATMRPLLHSDYVRLIVDLAAPFLLPDGCIPLPQFLVWWELVVCPWKLSLFHAEADWCAPHSVLYGFVTPEQVLHAMQGQPPGSYLFRCASKVGEFAVEYVNDSGQLVKAVINATCPGVAFTSGTGTQHMFRSLIDLAASHPCLKQPCLESPYARVHAGCVAEGGTGGGAGAS